MTKKIRKNRQRRNTHVHPLNVDRVSVTRLMGLNLRLVRAARKLTQKQLAARIGIEPSQITKAERGKSMPTRGALMRWCEFLSVPLASLLNLPAGMDDRQLGLFGRPAMVGPALRGRRRGWRLATIERAEQAGRLLEGGASLEKIGSALGRTRQRAQQLLYVLVETGKLAPDFRKRREEVLAESFRKAAAEGKSEGEILSTLGITARKAVIVGRRAGYVLTGDGSARPVEIRDIEGAVYNMWNTGKTASEIGKELKLPKNGVEAVLGLGKRKGVHLRRASRGLGAAGERLRAWVLHGRVPDRLMSARGLGAGDLNRVLRSLSEKQKMVIRRRYEGANWHARHGHSNLEFRRIIEKSATPELAAGALGMTRALVLVRLWSMRNGKARFLPGWTRRRMSEGKKRAREAHQGTDMAAGMMV